MPRRTRLAAALAAGALTATLTPAAAQAADHIAADRSAADHTAATAHPGYLTGGAKPVLAPAVTRHVTAAAADGITPAVTATNVQGDGLTVSFDATASSDANAGDTITGYSFAFGDGQSTDNTTGTTTHQYAGPGTYTVTVTVTDSGGNTATATTTQTTAGSDFTPVVPDRILDTRSGLGAPEAKLDEGKTVAITIAGADSIPADVSGVVLNLTAVDTVANGSITCYPGGLANAPTVSNLNYTAGQPVDNLITVPVGTDGKIDCTLSGDSTASTDLIGDLQGYYDPTQADGYTALQPGRILDTRSGLGGISGTLNDGKTMVLTIDGATATTNTNSKTGNTTYKLPTSGVAAVALNITAANTVGNGIITAYPDGATGASGDNLNYPGGVNVANSAVVKVGTDGKIDLIGGGDSSATADVIVDVTGYYSAASPAVYVPVTPTRLVDTRKIVDDQLPAGEYYHEQNITNADGVTAYVLNTTVTDTTAGGDLAVFPDTSADNETSNINFASGQTIANQTQATTGSTGIDFMNEATSGSLQLIIDEFGYLTTQ